MKRELRASKPAEPDAERVAAMVGELSGKSEAELMEHLASATKAARADGSLDDTRMDEIYRMLSPMLTEGQQQKMQEVIRRMKS